MNWGIHSCCPSWRSIQSHATQFSLFLIELGSFRSRPFLQFLLYCPTSRLIVFFLCRSGLVQMNSEQNFLSFSTLPTFFLSLSVTSTILLVAHLQPLVTTSEMFLTTPPLSHGCTWNEWEEKHSLNLPQTHKEELNEWNKFLHCSLIFSLVLRWTLSQNTLRRVLTSSNCPTTPGSDTPLLHNVSCILLSLFSYILSYI